MDLGMKKDSITNLFKEFGMLKTQSKQTYNLKSVSFCTFLEDKNAKGTGLGLSICKKIVNR